MIEQKAHNPETNKPEMQPSDEHFTPKGTLVLMIAYVIIFAAAWGLVYFNDLLARR